MCRTVWAQGLVSWLESLCRQPAPGTQRQIAFHKEHHPGTQQPLNLSPEQPWETVDVLWEWHLPSQASRVPEECKAPGPRPDWGLTLGATPPPDPLAL